MSAERLRIIERVQKLFILAEQQESPEEAKIAALRAQEILQKYDMSISEVEIKDEGFNNCNEHKFIWKKLRIPAWVKILHTVVASGFDVMPLRGNTEFGCNMVFIGVEPDVTIARYTFEYLLNFVNTYDLLNFRVKDRNDWRLGFVYAIGNRFRQQQSERKTNAHSTDLVLAKNTIVEQFMAQKYPFLLKAHTKVRAAGKMYNDGYRVGMNTPLNRPIEN
jgi:hypothetical protein